MLGYVEQGHFASGSMGPKVEALCRFVQSSGRPGVITDLPSIVQAVAGGTGTLVVPDSGTPLDSPPKGTG